MILDPHPVVAVAGVEKREFRHGAGRLGECSLQHPLEVPREPLLNVVQRPDERVADRLAFVFRHQVDLVNQ